MRTQKNLVTVPPSGRAARAPVAPATCNPASSASVTRAIPAESRMQHQHELKHERLLNELMAHMQVRVGELTHALEANASVQVTIAGKDGKPSLGKGAAAEQWRGQLGARLGADAHAQFVEALDAALLLLAADFPQRVRFGAVSGAAASIEHFQVWGANARNWQRPDGAKISGSGQAAAMGVQRPGVFGIITTPKYPLNAGSPDPKRCAVL